MRPVRMGIVAAVILSTLTVLGTGCGSDQAPAPPAGEPPAAAAPQPAPAAPPAAQVPADADGAPLLAWAEAEPDEGKAPLQVRFKADVEGGTPPLTFEWKFGDGSLPSTDANPVHTYTTSGSYRADLAVKDSGGDTDSDYVEIEVR
jgi:hypothetical protein